MKDGLIPGATAIYTLLAIRRACGRAFNRGLVREVGNARGVKVSPGHMRTTLRTLLRHGLIAANGIRDKHAGRCGPMPLRFDLTKKGQRVVHRHLVIVDILRSLS